MNKYSLKTIIRVKNPYAKIAKATQEHRTCKNILKRQFGWLKVFEKLWTDITYLYYNGLWFTGRSCHSWSNGRTISSW